MNIGSGTYDVSWTWAVTLTAAPRNEHGLRLWSPSLVAWVPLQTASQVNSTTVRYTTVSSPSDCTNGVLFETPSWLTSTAPFIVGGPVTTIPAVAPAPARIYHVSKFVTTYFLSWSQPTTVILPNTVDPAIRFWSPGANRWLPLTIQNNTSAEAITCISGDGWGDGTKLVVIGAATTVSSAMGIAQASPIITIP